MLYIITISGLIPITIPQFYSKLSSALFDKLYSYLRNESTTNFITKNSVK